jgi:hypothetical protein
MGMGVIYDGMMTARKGERIVVDRERLRQCIKQSYQPLFYERRIVGVQAPDSEARSRERRQKEEEIPFLERRRMVYK